jgi:hypothetical protein
MDKPADHRGVSRSVAENSDGTWRWQLHPKIEPNVHRAIIKGVSPTRDEAIAHAEAAIDEMLKS